MGPPIPPSISPCTRVKAAAGETPQLPSQQTDESLCPGSWLPWKPPISFPVGTGCRGFSLLRSITEQVSSSQPLFLGTCLELLSRIQIPFQEWCPSRKRGGAVILPLSPGRALFGKSATGTRTKHLSSSVPGQSHSALHGHLFATLCLCFSNLS